MMCVSPATSIAGEAFHSDEIHVCKTTGGIAAVACAPDDVRAVRDIASATGGKKLSVTFTVPHSTENEAVGTMAVQILAGKVAKKGFGCVVGRVALQTTGVINRSVIVSGIALKEQAQCDAVIASHASLLEAGKSE